MQVTETSADGLKREFTITVPAGDLEQEITRRLDEIGRTGAAARASARARCRCRSCARDSAPRCAARCCRAPCKPARPKRSASASLRPALPPKVDIVSADEGADLEYKMAVEVLPEIPEPSFADLGIERLVVEVPDEDVDRAIERIAEQQRKSEVGRAPCRDWRHRCRRCRGAGLANRRSRAPAARTARSCWARAAPFRASRTSWSAPPPASTVRCG